MAPPLSWRVSPAAWPALARLEGCCRGSLLADWAGHLRRRHGPGAERRIYERLGVDRRALPPRPDLAAWLPVAWQIGVTDAVVAEFHGGDYDVLWELLPADAGRLKMVALGRFLLRRLGPRRVVQGLPGSFAHLYDRGDLTVEVGAGRAELTYGGAAFMDNTTWQLLQLIGMTHVVELCGVRRPEVRASAGGGASLRIFFRW